MNAIASLATSIAALHSRATEAHQRRAAGLRLAAIAGQPTVEAHSAANDAAALIELADGVQAAFAVAQSEIDAGAISEAAATLARAAIERTTISLPASSSKVSGDSNFRPGSEDEAAIASATSRLASAEHRAQAAAIALAEAQTKVDAIEQRLVDKRREKSALVAAHLEGRAPADAAGTIVLIDADAHVLTVARADADAEAQPLRAALAESQRAADFASQQLCEIQRQVALREIVVRLTSLDMQMVQTLAVLSEIRPASAGAPPWGASARLRDELRRLAAARFEL